MQESSTVEVEQLVRIGLDVILATLMSPLLPQERRIIQHVTYHGVEIFLFVQASPLWTVFSSLSEVQAGQARSPKVGGQVDKRRLQKPLASSSEGICFELSKRYIETCVGARRSTKVLGTVGDN